MELVNNTNKETTTTAQNTRTYGKKTSQAFAQVFNNKKSGPSVCVCANTETWLNVYPTWTNEISTIFSLGSTTGTYFFVQRISAILSINTNLNERNYIFSSNKIFAFVVVVTVLSFDGRLIPPFLSHNSISFIKKNPSLNHKSFRAEFKLLS